MFLTGNWYVFDIGDRYVSYILHIIIPLRLEDKQIPC